jgi:copper ion binding protein
MLMEHLTLTVTGMSCGGCENAVRRAVGSIAGVSDVIASHKESRVDVDYDAAQTDRGAIANAITAAGYTVAR